MFGIKKLRRRINRVECECNDDFCELFDDALVAQERLDGIEIALTALENYLGIEYITPSTDKEPYYRKRKK